MSRYVKNDGSLEALKSLVRKDAAKPLNSLPRQQPLQTAPPIFNAAKTTSEISARSGTTVGTGTADIYRIDDEDELIEAEEIDVVNIFGATIATGLWIQVARDSRGRWQVVSVECGA